MQGNSEKFILLTFDVEEFDMPLDYSQPLERSEQLSVGRSGLEAIIELLGHHPQVRATFFTTAFFAMNYPDLIRKIAAKHEIASHTYFNRGYSPHHVMQSKNILESIIQKKITGIRMPQMQEADINIIKDSGYRYDSSINPIVLPGRYNNLHRPKIYFRENGVLRIPASAWSALRFPLFWLTFKNIPYMIYRRMAIDVMKRTGYICLYFHPWEFINLSAYKIPFYTRRLSKDLLLKRLERLITDLSAEGRFITMNSFCEIADSER